MLRMLGEIEFAEWQCIAELIDNAFDDFSEIVSQSQPWPGGFKVSVSLPDASADLSGAEVCVSDTGRGMSREQLQQAVKAGISNNDRFDKLGLFGMGFNVSTARLGAKTTVLTTRDGDPEWIGVEIDFDTLGADFEAPDVALPKSDLSEHGTRVVISNLKANHADWLGRNADNLRNTLGRIYGWILDKRPFELWVQGVRVLPRRACRWGDERYVRYGGGPSPEKIPAYFEVDQVYQPAEACMQCGNWQDVGKSDCDQCGSVDLVRRERRIHGWLGIQRHLDKRDFGIDFLRNGRKILQYDKRLFEWSNPNDPLASIEVEYPVELSQGGRIIGEIHLDHVPVTYQKNAFEYGDRGWKAAVEFLRGIGPLRPERAKSAGYPENTSYVGLLFKGFRRNSAGIRCLIPGDGKGPIHDDTRRWAREFWAGRPEYQTDQIWFDAVLSHEERVSQEKLGRATGANPEDPDEAAVLAALGASTTDAGSGLEHTSGAPTKAETVDERLTRYRDIGTSLPDLTRDYGLPELGNVRVSAIGVVEGPVLDSMGQDTPVWLSPGPGGTANCIVDLNHPAFRKFGGDISVYLLIEVASFLKLKTTSSSLTTSQIVSRLQTNCLPDTAVDSNVIEGEARELLTELRQRMANQVNLNPQRALQHLTPDETDYMENSVIADGGSTLDLGKDGSFLLYVPPLFLVKLLEEWPEAFMDGHVFSGLYATLSSPSSRRLSLARIVGYLNDIATLLSFQTTPGTLNLQRTRLSVHLLVDELASDT
jgi:histidine kinase/DNA gyrase B/HSP90-like ATPase